MNLSYELTELVLEDLAGVAGRSCSSLLIVFNLVDHGILGRTENDSLDDFEGGYNFREAFEHPFLPKDKKNTDLN